MAFAFDPNGSAIVFARPDGSLATLEAGPNDCMWIRSMDMLPHLKEYADVGMVWIRRRRVPLTPEQSAQLTAFAMAVEGKLFALQRLGSAANALPQHAAYTRHARFVGKPHGCNRVCYFCSELVCACVAAGLP